MLRLRPLEVVAVSLYERIFQAAAKAWGRPAVFKAWPQISERWEHALFSWNDKYAPLNHEQREYACHLMILAIEFAGEVEDVGHKYACLHSRVNFYLNHEQTDAGFKERDTEPEGDIGAALDLAGVYE